MRKRLILTVCALAVSIAAACSAPTETVPISPVATPPAATQTGIPSLPPPDITFDVPPTTPTKTYSDDDGFSIRYPSKWTVADHMSGQCQGTMARVCFYAPAQEDQVPAAIVVSVFPGTTPTNLQTVWNTQRQLVINSLGSQPRTVPGTQGNTTMAGLPAKTADYTLSWGLIPSTARQTMVLAEDEVTAYTVSQISASQIWEGLEPAFEDVNASFKLTS